MTAARRLPAARSRQIARFGRISAGLLLAMAPLAGGAAHGPWGMPNWNGPGGDAAAMDRGDQADDSREGHVSTTRFVAEDAGALLGHGTIAVRAMPVPQTNDGDAENGENDGPRDDARPAYAPSAPDAAFPGGPPPPPAEAIHGPDPTGRQQAIFEAAVLDRLAHAGYNTAVPSAGTASSQIVEVRVRRDVAIPREARHKPVSGEMDMGVSNRGSGFGMALNIDLTKPRAALIATQIETRIRDAATGRALWEGRANILTREGDPHWGDDRVATTLATALFDGFPGRAGEHRDER